MPGRPGVALTVDGQRWTSANDATARAIGGSNCDAKHGAQRPARRIDHRREGFNFDTSVACRSCETALTLWQQSTCRVSKPRRGARAARVGRPRRGGHADPSRSSGLVSSRHPCACTFDSTIITRIAARVSKPCGVGALLAPHARPLPVAHPPSRCISLRWRRQAWKGARTLSAPEPHAPHDWMSRFSKCRVSKCPAPHVLADSTVRPARISKPCRRVHAARTACPPAHTRASPGAHRNRSASPPHRTPPRRRTARPPAQDIQQTASGPENAAHGVCALSLASPPPPPPSLAVPPCSPLPAGVLAAGVWCARRKFPFFCRFAVFRA